MKILMKNIAINGNYHYIDLILDLFLIGIIYAALSFLFSSTDLTDNPNKPADNMDDSTILTLIGSGQFDIP